MGDGIRKSFAVLINGDLESRHLGNIDRAMETLRGEKVDEIYVLSVLKPSGHPTHYAEAKGSNLKRVLQGLAGRIDDDDSLIVYSTGHGGHDDQGRECMELTDGCLPFSSFHQSLGAIAYGRRAVILDGCMSGGVLALFANSKTSVVTLGSPGEPVYCQSFSPFFWSNGAPDSNQDGNITLQERYAHALGQNDIPSHPQFFPAEEDFGLNGSTTPAFPAEVVEVHQEIALRSELSRIQHGQLALVDFSADWCAPCQDYKPKFEELARQYRGRFLMIRAEGIQGSEKDWAKFGVSGFPTVAFIDSQGRIALVKDRENPLDSLIEAIQSKQTITAQFYANVTHQDPRRRLTAAYQAEALGPEKGAFTLVFMVGLLGDRDWDAASQALIALKKLEPIPGFTEKLLFQWLDRGSLVEKSAAKTHLAAVARESDEVLKTIADRLKSPRMEIRLEAAKMIDQTNFPKSHPGLVRRILASLEDSEPQVRIAAIKILKNPHLVYADKRAVGRALEKLLEDPSQEVSLAAAKTLYAMGENSKIVPTLKSWIGASDPLLQDQALELLARAEPSALEMEKLWSTLLERYRSSTEFPNPILRKWEGPMYALDRLAERSEANRAFLLEKIKNPHADRAERALAAEAWSRWRSVSLTTGAEWISAFPDIEYLYGLATDRQQTLEVGLAAREALRLFAPFNLEPLWSLDSHLEERIVSWRQDPLSSDKLKSRLYQLLKLGTSPYR
jgi:thioredoxin-like negative regulator of GroEL